MARQRPLMTAIEVGRLLTTMNPIEVLAEAKNAVNISTRERATLSGKRSCDGHDVRIGKNLSPDRRLVDTRHTRG